MKKSEKLTPLTKLIAALGLILALQVVAAAASFQISMHFLQSCQTAPGFLGWQCSGNSDPQIWVLLAMVIFPPILAKYILQPLRIVYSWRRILILHAAVLALFLIILAATDPTNHCGCGGA